MDLETGQFINFKYVGLSSDEIEFSLVDDKEQAAKFRYEDSAQKYVNVYKQKNNKDSYAIEIYK